MLISPGLKLGAYFQAFKKVLKCVVNLEFQKFFIFRVTIIATAMVKF